MKILVVSLALLLVLACGDALKCNYCVSKKPGGTCTTSVETCENGKDACARAAFLNPPYSSFRRCIKMTDCLMLKTNSYIDIDCCNTDLCNV
ncbi:neurotoxin 3FTx-RI-like [Megalops cyprinoides]|uniref:neurotoxin 3FTx-RI-like n=1 Tax=Megalops cyprinoides TaxID=118141 RepID=UPI0018654B48|nr:neurotoxin 3FTx-RI-like [Megalops cyprinoides]